jgi:hypothetical protein
MLALLVLAACFDPLYEDLQTGDTVFCCRNVSGNLGTPYSCQRVAQRCVDEPSCALPAFACFAPGTCSTVPCEPGFGGGAGGGMGGGGGGPEDAGVASDAGVLDAGVPDAGAHDAGAAPDAGPVFTEYEFCCVSGQITTCGCPPSGCGQRPFTACLQGTCTTRGACVAH